MPSYFISLNDDEYEIKNDSYLNKKVNNKKTLIENNMNKIKSYKKKLENYRTDLGNLNKGQYYKQIFPETNNPCLQDLNVKIETLKKILEEQNKQLKDINIVNKEHTKKIEELRDAIAELDIIKIELDDQIREKNKIKESQKNLLYFQFIQNLSNYYYGENIDTNISGKIQELVSILGYSSSDDTYPNTLVPYLTNQLKYITKKVPIQESLVQPNQSYRLIQLAPTSSINTLVEKVKNNKTQLK